MTDRVIPGVTAEHLRALRGAISLVMREGVPTEYEQGVMAQLQSLADVLESAVVPTSPPTREDVEQVLADATRAWTLTHDDIESREPVPSLYGMLVDALVARGWLRGWGD